MCILTRRKSERQIWKFEVRITDEQILSKCNRKLEGVTEWLVTEAQCDEANKDLTKLQKVLG